MHIKNINDLRKALEVFDYSLDKNAEFLGTGSEQVVVKIKNKVIHFIGLGYSKIKSDEIDIAVSEMKQYFSNLKKVNVSISNPDFDNVQIYREPFPLIIIEDIFEGLPVQNLMSKSDKDLLHIFEKLLNETLKAVKNNIAMDSSAKNYVINNSNEVVYVDFFIPYTEKWMFHKDKSDEYILFTSLNFFIPNCELFIFVSKSIIKKPELKNQILDILYKNIEGELLTTLKNKFNSVEFQFLLDNYKQLMDQYKEDIADEQIFKLIGYYDKTKKLLIKDSKILDSSYSINELYHKMNSGFIARPYNCLLWSKNDIKDALNLMKKIKSQAL